MPEPADDGGRIRGASSSYAPYFSVPATGIENLNDPICQWPFNDPGYTMFPVLNLAVGGSGVGDPTSGVYPAKTLVDWVRVF
jgi:hypothetical protein